MTKCINKNTEIDKFNEIDIVHYSLSPRFSKKKRGLCVTNRRPSVCLSGSSLPASPLTLMMLESPNLYAWYPYAYRWWQRIWHFSKSSSFEIIQILVILPKNAISLWIFHEIVSNFLSVWGKSYTSYIKRVLSCDSQITLENWNIDGGGWFWKKIFCYFSLPASSPTLLMLESPNLYAWYPYAYRWWQRIWNFSLSSSFDIIQILVILPKNAISLWLINEIIWKFVSVWGEVV